MPSLKNGILIADSGSTKTAWRLVTDSDKIKSIQTAGLNPYFKNTGQIKEELIKNLIPCIPKAVKVSKIFFYGAGCSVKEKISLVYKALAECFSEATIYVEHDILGAARAVCGSERGIISILGTGSNSCLYDGEKIITIIGGLGYILGDEGSGTHIGKTIISAYLNHDMPSALEDKFRTLYKLNKTSIIHHVYQMENANLFLSSFSLFAQKNISHPFMKKIVSECLGNFLDMHVCKYPDYINFSSGFTGSIAYHFKDLLVEECKKRSIKIGNIIKEPIEGLFKYHS